MFSLYGCQKAEDEKRGDRVLYDWTEERGDRVLYDWTKVGRTCQVLQHTYPLPYARLF